MVLNPYSHSNLDDHLRIKAILTSGPISPRVAQHPHTIPLKIARPMRVSEHPHLDVRPPLFPRQLCRERRVHLAPAKPRARGVLERRRVVGHYHDRAVRLVAGELADCAREPLDVALVQGLVDVGGEVIDHAEVVQSDMDEVDVLRVEPGPESAPEDGYCVGDVVSSTVKDNEAAVGCAWRCAPGLLIAFFRERRESARRFCLGIAALVQNSERTLARCCNLTYQGRPVGFMIARKEENKLEPPQLGAKPVEEAVIVGRADIPEQSEYVCFSREVVLEGGVPPADSWSTDFKMEVAEDLYAQGPAVASGLYVHVLYRGSLIARKQRRESQREHDFNPAMPLYHISEVMCTVHR